MKQLHLFLCLAVVSTLLTGMIYAAVQQNLRQSANDPQIQMAEDTANLLNKNVQLPLDSPTKVDAGLSLSPFLIIYDQFGNVLNATVVVDGKTPPLPSGVFQTVRNSGEARFTWQPQPNVRIAAVVVQYDKGFVLAGRSLREVEKREDQLTRNLLVGWIVTLGMVFILSFFPHKLSRK